MTGGAAGEVTWTLESGPRELDEEATRRALASALQHGGAPDLTVDVVFVDDPTLAELHGTFLDDPSPTDVITFDLRDGESAAAADPAGAGADAEIYVSVDRAREVAAERGSAVADELALYVVHGALHLVGFDDRSPADQEEMRRAEAEVLARLGVARSPDRHAP
ncbi:MAG: rRNA maturation RNase YbeY [Planctomycetota bacterium]